MPHPMTRLCGAVRRNELKFHSLAPCHRVVDTAEGSQALFEVLWLDLMHLFGKAMPLAGVRVRQFCTASRGCDMCKLLIQRTSLYLLISRCREIRLFADKN